MRALLRIAIAAVFLTPLSAWAAAHSSDWPQSSAVAESGQRLYYWRSTSVGGTAQLLTLFCRLPNLDPSSEPDVPVIAVLRDTLGDANPENDRVAYIWLLTYSRLGVGQRVLSAVPFFYWRVGEGSTSVSPHDMDPLFDLTAPQHPVLTEAGRDLLQWTMLDPMTTPVRASSRAYRTNQIDHERLHLVEAVTYLRQAPVTDDESALTSSQRDSVIARLELRKRLLGGLVAESHIARLGEEAGFEQERVRSRNWEFLRQCAERTGLFFEPVEVGGTTGEYAILWFALNGSPPTAGTSLSAVWKLLNIRNPWSDDRLTHWRGPVYTRALDGNGAFLPEAQTGDQPIELVPLGVYSLNYPKLPLLLIDFRDKLHVRRHELTQRSINEITSGVIGISHFTNWYYYVGADLYDFVVARHGSAINQAARLDAYSEFRVALALDHQLDPKLRADMQHRVDALTVNPMESAPERELEAARERYQQLQAEAENGNLAARLDQKRRSELGYFSASQTGRVFQGVLHAASFGLYTERAKPDPENLQTLDAYRRLDYQLRLLEGLVTAGTQPEVAYESSRLRAVIAEVTTLVPSVGSSEMRARAAKTLASLRGLSRDETVQADCSSALLAFQRNRGPVRNPAAAAGVAASMRTALFASWDNASTGK